MNRKRWAYGPGFITETPQGTYSCFVALGHSRRRRAVCKTLAEAKAWILAGTGSEPPDRLLLEDALRARSRLPPEISLDDAARYWAERHKSALSRVPLSEAWERFSAEASGRVGKRTLCQYRTSVARLRGAVGDAAYIGDISAETIEAMLRAATPYVRNDTRSALSVFFNWCVAHGLLEESPVAAVRKAKIRRAPPGVFTVDETRAILDTARRVAPSTVAYFSLCLFAGVRPEEALRLRPGAILNGYVVLTAKETKTGDARTIPIAPNLAAWLAAYPVPDGGYSIREIKAVRTSVGFRWKQDGARHSYATYAFERQKDAAAVAATMGHVGTDVFYKHYRALAAPGSGEEFFSIEP